MTEWPDRLVLLGHPLGHSLSPVFQNAALRAAGIPLTYELVDVPRSVLDETVTALRRGRAAGNVTRPHKEALLAMCDRVSDVARVVGAVNTFWTGPDGALVGDNTDVAGFQVGIAELIGAPGPEERIALLGAGGGAAAVLHAIEGWQGAAVRVYSRTQHRAEALLGRFRVAGEIARSAEEAVKGATLVINATPIGLKDDTVPVSIHALDDGTAVFDLAYRIGGTALVRDARARGLRATDGLRMLVEQGALAFERWFGIAPDREEMWRAVQTAV
jgi:shikimate dehydrogenase